MDVSIALREITGRGKVIIESRLEPGYYDYTVGGFETIALDRVAEALFDITNDQEILPGSVGINLSSTVIVGNEALAASIYHYLVLEVTAFDQGYSKEEEFEKLLTTIGQKATKCLVMKTRGGKSRFRVETDKAQYILIC